MLNIFNNNFQEKIGIDNIVEEFSGLRPIVSSKNEKKAGYFSYASREARIEVNKKVLTMYGGKWTSAPSLSKKVLKRLIKMRKIYA